MRFLIEQAKLVYIDKEYEGERVGGTGVRIPLSVASLWDDKPEYKEYYLFELLEDIAERYRSWRNSTKINKTTLCILVIISQMCL